jgi:eukaryotic-like serine/threonine-protein kinase
VTQDRTPSGGEERVARATRRMVPEDAAELAPDEPDRIGAATQQLATLATFHCSKCARTYSGSERFCPFDGQALEESVGDRAADPLIGVTVAERYVVESVLGHGGMGTVYRVRHNLLESAFAMKVLHPDLLEDAEVAPRLITEARATAAIGHPNIVTVSDFGEIDESLLPELGEQRLPYFVMEHLSGPSLAEVLELEGTLGKERLAQLVLQVASALAAAHKAGIVHRDLKPENIRLARDDVGREIAKVLDFGVAKVIGSSTKTRQGMVFGTPFYMSPEQGQGEDIDARTDVYALGVIMYECLSGRVPFMADTFMGVLKMHLFEAVPPLEKVRGRIPLEPIMDRCLEKDPDARYQTMGEVVAAIEGIVGRKHAGQTGRYAVTLAPQKTGDAKRWLWAGLTVVAAAAVATAVVRYAGSSPSDTPMVGARVEASVSAPVPPSAEVSVTPTATATASTIASATATASATAKSAIVPGPLPLSIPGPLPGELAPPPTVEPQPPPPSGSKGDVVDPWD